MIRGSICGLRSHFFLGIDDEDFDGETKLTGAPKERIDLEVNRDGMPILPPWEALQDGLESLEAQKELIRSFVIIHYSERNGRSGHNPQPNILNMYYRASLKLNLGPVALGQDCVEAESIHGQRILRSWCHSH